MQYDIDGILKQALNSFKVKLPTEVATLEFIGSQAALDSVSFVSFLIEIEMLVFENYQVRIVCLSDKALSRSLSPFKNYNTLAAYILELIENEKNLHHRN